MKRAAQFISAAVCILLLACGIFAGSALAADEPGLTVVELTPETVYTAEGDFTVSGLYTDILSRAAMSEGWVYYYMTGTEPGYNAGIDWVPGPGMYTSCRLFFSLENLKEQMDEPFTGRFRGAVVYNLTPDAVSGCESSEAFFEKLTALAESSPEAEIFSCTPMQRNPNQYHPDGYATASADAVPLGRNEAAMQDVIADVSESFLNSWEDSSAQQPMWAFFSYSDDAVFAVNLRQWLTDG